MSKFVNIDNVIIKSPRAEKIFTLTNSEVFMNLVLTTCKAPNLYRAQFMQCLFQRKFVLLKHNSYVLLLIHMLCFYTCFSLYITQFALLFGSD